MAWLNHPSGSPPELLARKQLALELGCVKSRGPQPRDQTVSARHCGRSEECEREWIWRRSAETFGSWSPADHLIRSGLRLANSDHSQSVAVGVLGGLKPSPDDFVEAVDEEVTGASSFESITPRVWYAKD